MWCSIIFEIKPAQEKRPKKEVRTSLVTHLAGWIELLYLYSKPLSTIRIQFVSIKILNFHQRTFIIFIRHRG